MTIRQAQESGPIRLQKILARAGVASRRGAETLIREGRVTVNGKLAILGTKADPAKDSIKVDNRRVAVEEVRTLSYLLLNKPRGYLTTRSDPEGRPTVFDLIPPALHRGLVSVGRLDFDTEGLLLLTNDGDFAQQVAHPSYGCVKTYSVKVKGTPEKKSLDRLRAGIVLAGRRTRPTGIEALRGRTGRRALTVNTWWKVELSEGRTRQVREMFERIGHTVLRLKRTGIGSLSDSHLASGDYRSLRPAEVEALGSLAPKEKEKLQHHGRGR